MCPTLHSIYYLCRNKIKIMPKKTSSGNCFESLFLSFLSLFGKLFYRLMGIKKKKD